MEKRLDQFIQDTFALSDRGDKDKVLPLKEAIETYVRPKMMLNIPGAPNAAINEITRRFWGTDPGFTLTASLVTGNLTYLVQGNMVDKLITSNCSELYPTPRPIKLFQDLLRKKRMTIENWSLYSIQQALTAGALGLSCMPTKSIVGTDMVGENKETFKMIDDPFTEGEKIGLIKAIRPDLSIVHGWAADQNGNTILAPPYDEYLWGPKAAEKLVVTVEKLVSVDFIRAHAPLVQIPGYMVDAVSVAPFGAHPQPMMNRLSSFFEPYGEDQDFLNDRKEALKDSDKLEEWIEKWVIRLTDHDAYLNALGRKRLVYLKGITGRDASEALLKENKSKISLNDAYNATEMMIVAAGREIQKRVVEKGHKVIQIGVGVGALAACLAHYELKKKGIVVELVFGNGPYGLEPRPGDPYMMSLANLATSKMLTDYSQIYGVVIGGSRSRCLSILGAAQVDKFGNLNSTMTGRDRFLIGAGGAGDAINAREIIVVAHQSKDRFVEKVPYISCPGIKTKRMITTKGIFEKEQADSEFVFSRYYPAPQHVSLDDHLADIKRNCGWEMKLSERMEALSEPTWEELMTIRLLDPERYFLKD